MDKAASNITSLKPASCLATKNTQKDLKVTQYNSSVVHEFARVNLEKASKKIDRKALILFNDFVQSS